VIDTLESARVTTARVTILDRVVSIGNRKGASKIKDFKISRVFSEVSSRATRAISATSENTKESILHFTRIHCDCLLIT